MTEEQQKALEVLNQFVNSIEYREQVKANIERENVQSKAIEQSLKPSQQQYQQAYNL